MSMDANGRRKLVLPVWRLWLMNQAFRASGRHFLGFGPGAFNLLRYEALRVLHVLYERDRLRWWALRLRHAYARLRGRG